MTAADTPECPRPAGDPVAGYLLSLPDAEVTELLAGCLARAFAREASGAQYCTRRPARRPGPIDLIRSGT